MPTPASSSSRRRYAPRSSPSSLRSPPPAAPVAGIAPARRGSTPCVAAHRLPHRSLHSRGCSCGARPHFVPHRAGHCCPHRCGQRRLRLRQRAAHDCPRLRPHRPPLTRRGGSLPPASPASIPPSLSPGFVAFLDAGRRFGLTPHASLMQACHRAPCPVLAGSSGAARGRTVVGASELRAQLANRHRPVIGWHRLSASAVRTDLSGVRSVFRACCAEPTRPAPPVTDRSARAVREIAWRPPFRGERCVQSAASSRSDSSNARASPTSFSSSSPRPSRSIAPRFSVARNQV